MSPSTGKSEVKARPAAGRTRKASAGGKRKKVQRSGFNLLAELFGLTFFGRVLLVCLLTSLVLALNLLLSGNQYDLFFIILGVELILTALVCWLRLLLRKA